MANKHRDIFERTWTHSNTDFTHARFKTGGFLWHYVTQYGARLSANKQVNHLFLRYYSRRSHHKVYAVENQAAVYSARARALSSPSSRREKTKCGELLTRYVLPHLFQTCPTVTSDAFKVRANARSMTIRVREQYETLSICTNTEVQKTILCILSTLIVISLIRPFAT